ncbi:AraC family transcriptional regulator [Sphingobacterium corticibacter]|uniref:AraC family transcriptional regulator n=1 Tax=Sphingobacterium corticibacter TaxID=2171749 RepID=A0A2T8HGW4_9SPHI|nr:helix-turn-helix transcriptional regulator [Sphingobacterium corticibacter]PVH24688.1 AraC family transcriptional regulator [Sphingobacterium corticibacter]
MDRKEIQIKDKLEYQRLIKVVPFDLSKNLTTPHKHNGYLELVFLSCTTGRSFIDGRETKIKSPCLLVIKKDNVHHWELTNPVKGFVLLVKSQFVERSLDLEVNRLVDRIGQFDTIYFNQDKVIEKLFELLAVEENRICQEGLFKVILAKALEYTTDSTKSFSVQKHIYYKFCALLNETQIVENHVAYYASILNTSPQNLNAACKKNINLTASEVLAGHIIKEAKRLLFYTTKSVSEVAYQVGFTDKSNFSKYFKRYTGLSPANYRKQKP